MTIGEHLQQRIRLCQRVKWAGVFILVVTALVTVALKHSNAESYAWLALVAAPWLVAVSVAGKRAKCPRCQKSLFKDLAYSVPTPSTLVPDFKREVMGQNTLALEACPHCGGRFSDPHVGSL